MWRSLGFGGRDVDLVAVPGREDALAAALTAAGFVALPRGSARTMWAGETGVLLDLMSAPGWPRGYPPLDAVVARAIAGDDGVLRASAGDRLLVFAADAIGGRPTAKLADKAEGALREEGARDQLERIAREHAAPALAALASDPERLRAAGRIGWAQAARAAARDRLARRALRERIERAVRARLRRAPKRGLLIALSGMDGSGKSTAARAAAEYLTAAGLDAEVHWARLGQEARVQDAIARPIKRILGARGTVADPVAATIGADREALEGREVERRTGIVAFGWTIVVAAITASAYRRTVRERRAGKTIVCDRWLTDSLVDLEVRYGRNPVAAALLRAVVPRPDLGVLLAIDTATSLERKPGDQAESVLRRMEPLYAQAARSAGVAVVDATRTQDEVLDDLRRLLDDLVTHRGSG